MDSPVISIVLPTYNGSRYIRKSVDSCLQQSFADFELILVNDCSTDDTASILEEYVKKDARVRVINNAFNKKLPLSLNAGFESATGKYFTWTSDDNFYAPSALQKMWEVLEKDSNIDLVYADYTLIDDKDKIFGVRKFGDVNKSFNRWLGAGACFLYKKEIHRANNGYNPAAFLIEDYDFFVRAFIKFRFQYLPLADLYYYREHAASLTSTQNTAINDISKIFLERNLAGLEKKLSPQELKLLYRKLAIYFSVYKNNASKYKWYLGRISSISMGETAITVLYVCIQKLWNAVYLGFSGIVQFFILLFTKTDKKP
ncbi:MAG: glycosyltransferase family 2 protein [Flavisolibacter sp.]